MDVPATKFALHIRQCSFGCQGEPSVFLLLTSAIQASIFAGYSQADGNLKEEILAFSLRKSNSRNHPQHSAPAWRQTRRLASSLRPRFRTSVAG